MDEEIAGGNIPVLLALMIARVTDEGWVTLGILAIAGLALIPVVLVGRVVLAMITESRKARAAEARRVTRNVPGLGEFSSTDDELWLGEVSGLQVMLTSRGRPPTDAQANQVRAIIADLAGLVAKSRAYLSAHEDCTWLEGGAAGFEPAAIEPGDAATFALEMAHPTDVEGVYRVTFRDGEPVASCRDD